MVRGLRKFLGFSKDLQSTLQHQHNLTLKCNIKLKGKEVACFLVFGADVESMNELVGLVQVIVAKLDATATEKGGE